MIQKQARVMQQMNSLLILQQLKTKCMWHVYATNKI